MTFEDILTQRMARAGLIAGAGGLEAAIGSGRIPGRQDITLSEAIVLGLLRQDVTTFFAVFGHGSTDVAEVLRVYQDAGLVKVINLRSEIEASHAAAALRWVSGEKSAVVTSIGPGALQALSASLVSASDGLGIWYLFGDETIEDEGPNMQQIPRPGQDLFLRLCSVMGNAYTLHTPLAVSTALRRGQSTVDHPYRAGPFYLLLPMNTQPYMLEGFDLRELPADLHLAMGAAEGDYAQATKWIIEARNVVVRVGGGAIGAKNEMLELLELADGVAVLSPLASGRSAATMPWRRPICS
ncbi:MAG: thiamine pyrophosphate-binding protein [Chloroflexi bacterium]|nr:thiamine pyrophosphate-binding protein [Chloroflexota bacterium]